jgi:hypothetical protein
VSRATGRGAAWLARWSGGPEVPSSNLGAPIVRSAIGNFSGGNHQSVPSRESIEVAFRFPHSAEIRFVESPPAVGDLVHTRHGQTWMVAEVQVDENRLYVAECVSPASRSHRVRDIAFDLLGRLTRPRPTGSSVEGIHRRSASKDRSSP